MNSRAPISIALCAVAIGLGACGGEEAPSGPDPADKRAFALNCIRAEANFDVTESGERELLVGNGTDVRIEFFTSTGEAEGKQFLGGAQDAQQIGAALLHVGRANDDQLEALEECLNNQ